jgi:hypothetical protein
VFRFYRNKTKDIRNKPKKAKINFWKKTLPRKGVIYFVRIGIKFCLKGQSHEKSLWDYPF